MNKTVMAFKKNVAEEVRATLQEYKGRHYVSLRIYVENDLGEWVPTKKGLTLTVDLLPELVQAVRLLEAEAIRAGLVEEERFEGVVNG